MKFSLVTSWKQPMKDVGRAVRCNPSNLQVFDASRSRRGDKGRDDRRFLEALHYFVVHNIAWRALRHLSCIPYKSNAIDRPAFFPKILYQARARIEQAVGKLTTGNSAGLAPLGCGRCRRRTDDTHPSART